MGNADMEAVATLQRGWEWARRPLTYFARVVDTQDHPMDGLVDTAAGHRVENLQGFVVRCESKLVFYFQ